MTTNKAALISLEDYSPATVWFVSTGIPTGIDVDLVKGVDPETGEEYDVDPFDAANSLPFDMANAFGTVSADGEWDWNGEGSLSDWNRNTVTALRAFK